MSIATKKPAPKEEEVLSCQWLKAHTWYNTTLRKQQAGIYQERIRSG